MSKKISIIMGIYNCADTLSAAIDSILNQTYQNWELILCDDCSQDSTYSLAKQYLEKYPEKIKLLKNDVNKGLNHTLNRCLAVASGEYIARMDGDDISYPDRLEKEAAVLENNPDIAIVSTDMEFFDENGVWGRTHVNPVPTKRLFIKGTPFCHAACLVRKEAYMAVEGYSEEKRLLRVEDYHLWVKMYAKGYKGVNIKEILYQMRDDRSAQKRKKLIYRFNEAYVMRYAIKHLKLPFYWIIFSVKPIIIGMLPSFIYKALHRYKRSK